MQSSSLPKCAKPSLPSQHTPSDTNLTPHPLFNLSPMTPPQVLSLQTCFISENIFRFTWSWQVRPERQTLSPCPFSHTESRHPCQREELPCTSLVHYAPLYLRMKRCFSPPSDKHLEVCHTRNKGRSKPFIVFLSKQMELHYVAEVCFGVKGEKTSCDTLCTGTPAAPRRQKDVQGSMHTASTPACKTAAPTTNHPTAQQFWM